MNAEQAPNSNTQWQSEPIEDLDELQGERDDAAPAAGDTGEPMPDPNAGADVEAGAEGEVELEVDPLDALTRERDELKDKLVRAMADYQNMARRSQQSVAQARDEAKAGLARSFITVLDTIDRALELDPEKTDARAVMQGVESIRDEVLRVLGQAGIEKIEAQPGEEFDPVCHEALMRQPAPEDADIASGHIVTQLQPGYRLNGKTIRAAQVAIAD